MRYFVNKIYNLNLIIVLSIFFLDRLLKIYIIKKTEETGSSVVFLSEYLNLQLVWNKGIAFGLLSIDESVYYNLITLLIFIVIIILIYFANKCEGFEKISYILIISGALGNIFDRIYYNAVPDFIDLNYKGYHWFIFNVADIFITLGIICLIFAELLNYKISDEKK
jgi:signal peptidase II